jgi:hypothetical protein
MRARYFVWPIAVALAAACADPRPEADEPRLGLSLAEAAAGCPNGYVDMLDWMTLDADLRANTRLASSQQAGSMVYTSVESDRFWWLKTPQGDTWDVNTYDADNIYFAMTELGFHSPWACKPAVDTRNWRAARRCAKPGHPLDRIVNANSTFQLVSSSEVQTTSGTQGTIFTLRDLGSQAHGALGVLPTLVLDYQWNCVGGACDRLEQYFLTKRYGLVGWKYFESGVLKGESAFDHTEVAAAPTPMLSCLTAPEYRRVSVGAGGAQANGASYAESVDGAGRFVTFVSEASNLVPGDTNGAHDVFLYDDVARATVQRVSVATDGSQSNGGSFGSVVSRDGQARWIAFASDASNLVPGDTNGATDIFVHDRVTGETKLVSVGLDGPANDRSYFPAINGDGCIVAFHSFATNLVSDDTNRSADVFVRNHCTGTTTRVSVNDAGLQGDSWSQVPKLDDQGRFVAYTSAAQNLVADADGHTVQGYLYDSLWRTTTRIGNAPTGGPPNGDSGVAAMSTDQDVRYFLLHSDATNLVPNDSNGVTDLFLVDRWQADVTKQTRRVSVRSDGTQASAKSRQASLSADGRFVAFSNDGSDLATGGVAGGAYLHDAWTGQTIAPRSLGGGTPNGGAITSFPLVRSHTRSVAGAATTDGITLVWESEASNLVASDTNAAVDVFLRVVRVP